MAAHGGAPPEGLVASSESLEAGGAYVLENGHEALLHVDKGVPPALLQVRALERTAAPGLGLGPLRVCSGGVGGRVC